MQPSQNDSATTIKRCQHGVPRGCADCRLRKRELDKQRQRRHRAAVRFAEEMPPLYAMMLFFTENTEWIEAMLRAQDQARHQRPGWRPEAHV